MNICQKESAWKLTQKQQSMRPSAPSQIQKPIELPTVDMH